MSFEVLLIFGVVSFIASLFSGISGGGGGFITTPTLILLGLPPAQAVSSGKFVGLSVAIGSLGGMKQVQSQKLWRKVLPVVLLAFVIGLLAPFVIKNLNPTVYQRALGLLLLLMIPVLMFKKVSYTKQATTRPKTYIGAGF